MRGLLASSSSCEVCRHKMEETRIQIHYMFNIANFDLPYMPHDLYNTSDWCGEQAH
jgi:hypothetical protein